jgi:hypothetical protein
MDQRLGWSAEQPSELINIIPVTGTHALMMQESQCKDVTLFTVPSCHREFRYSERERPVHPDNEQF